MKNFHYTGFTDNLERRFKENNSGYNKSTKFYKPFELIYVEDHISRGEARKQEKFLKSGKGREFIKTIMANTHAGSP